MVKLPYKILQILMYRMIAFRWSHIYNLAAVRSGNYSGHKLVHFILNTELSRSSIMHKPHRLPHCQWYIIQLTSAILAFSYFANKVAVNITCLQEL